MPRTAAGFDRHDPLTADAAEIVYPPGVLRRLGSPSTDSGVRRQRCHHGAICTAAEERDCPAIDVSGLAMKHHACRR